MKLKDFCFALVITILFAVLIYLNQNHGFFIIGNSQEYPTYVSLRFDDGLKSQLSAFEILRQNNLSGSMYIITSKPYSQIGWQKEYYLNWSEIKQLSYFMEIGSHTITHRDLTRTDEYGEEIKFSKKELEAQGFNISTFVYPAGIYNTRVIKEVESNYECASTQDVGVNSLEIKSPHLLKDFTLSADNNIEDVKRVIKKGSWTILTFHDIDQVSSVVPDYYVKISSSNTISVEFFKDILDYLKSENINIITVENGCKQFKQ